jgi:hypothetical protein
MKSIQRSLSLSALCAVAFLPLHEALACSLAPLDLDWQLVGTLPADAATEVPVDQPLVIFAESGHERLSESDLAETTLELVGPSGTPIDGELRLAPFDDFLLFEPTAPLDSNTTYQWTVSNSRLRDSPEPAVWTFSFTTGAGTFDVGTRTAIGDLELRPRVSPVFGGCDPEGGFDSCDGCLRQQTGQVSEIGVTAPLTLESPSPQAFGIRVGLGATREEALAVADRSSLSLWISRREGLFEVGAGPVESLAWGADQVCVAVVVVDLLERTWLDDVRCAPLPEWLPVDEVDLETPEATDLETPVGPESPGDPEGKGASGGCNTQSTAFAPLLGLLLPFGLLRRRRTNSR